jgi:hypothetical protein
MAKRKNPASFAARHSPKLLPWMCHFAHWLVNQPKRPKVTEQRVKAQTLAGYPLNSHAMNALKARPDFQAYVEKISESALAEAKAMFENDYPRYVALHKESAEELFKREEFKAVADFTKPALERIAPRRDDTLQPTVVTVNISAKQLEGIETEAIIVESVPLE